MEVRIGTGKRAVARGLMQGIFATAAFAVIATANAAGPPQRIIVKWSTALPATEAANSRARTMSDMGGRYGVSMRMVRRMSNVI